jgi:muramoyltetrapeptide carboxypeptidase
MAARGGYGCLRLLEQMDFTTIRGNPKVFIGFSDISLLLNQLVRQAGVLSFHGPVVTSLCDCTRAALDRLYNCLTGTWRRAIAPRNLEILRSGEQVSGSLIGGNLNTLMTTLGTRYDFSWRDCILVLEDVNEPAYKLDRMLTQLGLSGKLTQPAGIILGDFTLNSDQQMLEKIKYTEYVWERVLGLTAAAGIPVWGNFPAGHCPENLTLPFGAMAVMDCSKGQLRFCA